MAESFITITDKFRGLHQCGRGEGLLKKGESPKMKNLTVTDRYTLIQRNGWEEVSATHGKGRALYIGDDIVWVVDDRVYLRNAMGEFEIGCLESTEGSVCIFPFASKLYFLDGVKIKVWDGVVFSELVPYVPTVAVSCDYLGAGTSFEPVNLLTGTKKQTFTPDGEHDTFQLAETEITGVDGVKLFGVDVARSKYSVNCANGTVTFNKAPGETHPNCLEITYTKGESQPELINRMRYAAAYGGDNDTRIFLWGDDEYPSHVRYSGVCNGTSCMEYFPELYFNRIGTGGKITSLLRHYDTLMIFTENEAFSCSGNTEEDASGVKHTVYPVRTVSSETGCKAMNFALLADNMPVTLTASGLYRWKSSTIRDERNAEEIGERIKWGLKELGTDEVRSFDRTAGSELYVWKGNSIYVYNYALDVFYYYEGFDAAELAEDGSGCTWFVKNSGELCRFTDERSDGGEPIPFYWESGYEEHSGLDMKNVHSLEFEIYPISVTGFRVGWVSERLTGRYDTLEIEYALTDFSNTRFEAFSFLTAVTPVRLHKRIKAKRTRGFKLMIENDGSRGDFHLLGVSVIGRLSDAR